MRYTPVIAALTGLALAGCASTGVTSSHPSAPASPSTNANSVAASACANIGGSWTGQSCDAPTPTPTPTPTGPEMLTVGSSETVGDASSNTTYATITVKSVSVTTQPAQAYGSAPANGYFVVAEVSATADPSYTDGFDINELDFYVLVGNNHYDPGNGNAFNALTDAQSNQDLTATLGAGQTSTGWIAFDVPKRHGYIVYAPNSNGQPLAEWSY